MAAITAAVVGVILNLSVWFALHVLFTTVTPITYGPIKLWEPEWLTLDWRVVVLASLSAVLLLKRHWSVVRVLAVAAAGGIILSPLS